MKNPFDRFSMRCPVCKHKLVQDKPQRYENTADHVLDPNGEHERPLRDTWKCNHCSTLSGFWDEDGGYYFGDAYKKDVEFIYKSGHHRDVDAIFSWDWYFRVFYMPIIFKIKQWIFKLTNK